MVRVVRRTAAPYRTYIAYTYTIYIHVRAHTIIYVFIIALHTGTQIYTGACVISHSLNLIDDIKRVRRSYYTHTRTHKRTHTHTRTHINVYADTSHIVSFVVFDWPLFLFSNTPNHQPRKRQCAPTHTQPRAFSIVMIRGAEVVIIADLRIIILLYGHQIIIMII